MKNGHVQTDDDFSWWLLLQLVLKPNIVALFVKGSITGNRPLRGYLDIYFQNVVPYNHLLTKIGKIILDVFHLRDNSKESVLDIATRDTLEQRQ